MNKLKLFSLFAAMLFAASMWAANPIGSIDAVSGKHGSITVNGWAIDPDNGGATVEVHVYLFSSETETDLAKAVKTFENGQVVIIKNGIKYNAMGVRL